MKNQAKKLPRYWRIRRRRWSDSVSYDEFCSWAWSCIEVEKQATWNRSSENEDNEKTRNCCGKRKNRCSFLHRTKFYSFWVRAQCLQCEGESPSHMIMIEKGDAYSKMCPWNRPNSKLHLCGWMKSVAWHKC